MNTTPAGLTCALLLGAALLAPRQSAAETSPARQRTLARGFSARASVRPPAAQTSERTHTLYGRIDGLHGTLLLVRTRANRLLRVDDSEALQSDNYSVPLFRGKFVVLVGWYDASRTLHARSVMRMGQLDPTTPPDR